MSPAMSEALLLRMNLRRGTPCRSLHSRICTLPLRTNGPSTRRTVPHVNAETYWFGRQQALVLGARDPSANDKPIPWSLVAQGTRPRNDDLSWNARRDRSALTPASPP